MHGVKRTRISPQAAEAKRLREEAKTEKYVALQQEVLAMKKNKDHSHEALKKVNELLDLNPEFYTIWNYRRNILQKGLFRKAWSAEVVNYLANEIKLTTAYLQIHPKVYWIWNHRKWCLEHVPLGPGVDENTDPKNGKEGWKNEFWKTELKMLEMMLDSDPRNFHAWNYRRYVIKSLPPTFSPPRTPLDELKYTQKKIEANFSNFSAWHLRTKLLGGLWEDLNAEEVKKEKDEEFELVTQALWTDPGDQSGWLYHRWLLGENPDQSVLRRELKNIRDLHETEPDSRWCMNALARNAILLANIPGVEREELSELRKEAKTMYERLEFVDEDRKDRYRELARQTV